MEKGAIRIFQIISCIIFFAYIFSYPWWKKPWVKYAGFHTVSWGLLWLCSLYTINAFSKPSKQTIFFAVFTGLTGVLGLIMNYLKK